MLSMKALNYGTQFKLYIVRCLLFTYVSGILVIYLIIIIIIIILCYIYVTLLGTTSLTPCVFGGIHISDLALVFYLFLL